MNLVSIVVPVYNAENYLTDCVDSIRAQSYQNIEILLVDDGSTDTSASLCDQLGQLDPRIRVIHQENRGVSFSRNQGIEQASGDFILFVDADDRISPGLVQDNLESMLHSNSDISIFGFDYVYDTPTRRETVSNTILQTVYVDEPGFFHSHFVDLFRREWMNCPWNKLIRRSILIENHIRFPEDYSICEDMIFSMTVLMHCRSILLHAGSYYQYFFRSNASLVTKYHRNQFEALSEYYRITRQYCMSHTQPEAAVQALNYRFISSSIAYIKRIANADSMTRREKKRQIRTLLNDPLFTSVFKETPSLPQKKITQILVRMRAASLLYLMYSLQRKVHQ